MIVKKTKYADCTFTPVQERARKIHRKADEQLFNIITALRTYPSNDRAYLHKRLDNVLDSIEREKNFARELFPDVDNSFTIAKIV